MNVRPILKKASTVPVVPQVPNLPMTTREVPQVLKVLPKIAIRHAIYQEISKDTKDTKDTKEEQEQEPKKGEKELLKKPIISLRPRTESKLDPESSSVVNISNQIWSPCGPTIDRSALGPNQRIVASFDVGIKHLAYCVMSCDSKKGLIQSKFKVFDWGIINLIDDETEVGGCNHLMPKTGKPCGKKTSYQVAPGAGETRVRLCGTHAKRVENAKLIPPPPKADSIPIQTLCTSMVNKLDEYPIFLQVDDVLIEQQPAFGSSRFGKKGAAGTGAGSGAGPGVHPRMKNLSYMIYSYFIMRGIVDAPHNRTAIPTSIPIKSVKFISSTNKLKLYDGPTLNLTQKSPYQRNKFQAKEHLKYILREQPELVTFFELFKKKDDLADCFLQGAWYLKKGI